MITRLALKMIGAVGLLAYAAHHLYADSCVAILTRDSPCGSGQATWFCCPDGYYVGEGPACYSEGTINTGYYMCGS